MSKVSRSVYQKLAEENKRLLADIRLLTEDRRVPSAEKILCVIKWQNKFREEKEFNEAMIKACRQYIKDHADELPEFITKSIKQ